MQRFVHVSAQGASYDSASPFLRAKVRDVLSWFLSAESVMMVGMPVDMQRESEDAVREFFPDAVILRPNIIHGETDRCARLCTLG